MEEKQDELARFYENVQKLQESIERLSHVQQSQSQHVRTEVAGDNTPKWAIVVMAVAVAAIAIMYVKTDAAREIADAQIKASEAIRQADMRDMSQIRARLMTLENYRQQHADRINELEKQNVPNR